MNETKKCVNCLQHKAIADFIGKMGKPTKRCGECQEKASITGKAYYQMNKKEIDAKNKAWYEKNKKSHQIDVEREES